MFSLVLLACGVCIGAALDTTKMIQVHQRTSSLADAAALAGASASEGGEIEIYAGWKNKDKDYDDIDREDIVLAYIEANAFKISPGVISGEPIIKFDDDNEVVRVTIPTIVKLSFGGFLGSSEKSVGATSSAKFLKNNIEPVSIAFALDVSGSMNWNAADGGPKIAALKSATGTLFDAIESGSDNPKQLEQTLRSGMSAYNTMLMANEAMDWGWDNLEKSVDRLTAGGGTNSTPALQNSYNQLLNDRAYRASKDKNYNPSILREYVIFMTDGDNNRPEWDTESAQVCKDIRADGIEIYSVAFQAPSKGELLLVECASFDDPEKANDNKDFSKCMNNGSKGKGNALGHCPDKDDKSEYFFDAKNAAAFKAAFKKIGEEIIRSDVRLN